MELRARLSSASTNLKAKLLSGYGKLEPGKKTSLSGTSGFLLYLGCAIAIILILSLYYVIKHRAFAFVDIGIDTYSYYFPFQIAQARQLHELHTLTWSFNAGLGSYIGWMSNSILLLNALLPESWQLASRLPVYFLKLALAGAFMFGYLRQLRFEPKLAAIGALALAFCDYAMINGQWDTQGYAIPQLAAYLFFLETYLLRRNTWLAVAAGLTVGSGATFDTYTFALLTALYIVARPFLASGTGTTSAYIASIFRYACWAALGFLVTAMIQVPNLLYFLSSPRVSGNHSILDTLLSEAWSLNSAPVITSEVAGIFGKGLLGTASRYQSWTNWFEAPGFYVGVLLLVCIPQLLGPRATRRERWIGAAGLALLLVYILWPFMRYAVYGFGHRGFRLSTLWVSVGLLILGLAGLRRALLTGAWRPGLVLSGIGIVATLLAIALRNQAEVNIPHMGMVIAFALVYCALLWWAKDGKPSISKTGLTCLFACELLLFAIPPVMQRNAVETNGSSTVGRYHDGTSAAIRLIGKLDGTQDFYRIEKTYRSLYLNDALVQGYSGTKSYFFHGKSITRFVDEMQLPRPHPRTNYIGSMAQRPDVLNILGVKYLLARDRKLDGNPDMTHLATAGKIHIYRNASAHGVAHLYRKVTGEDAAKKLSSKHRDALLLNEVVVDDPENIRERLAALDGDSPNANTTTPEVSLRKISDVHLQADVNAPWASILLVAMPLDSGWTATVDGTASELFRADFGLTALLLAPGRHEVTLKYAVPGRLFGTWLSLAALLMLLARLVWQAIRVPRHDEPQSQYPINTPSAKLHRPCSSATTY